MAASIEALARPMREWRHAIHRHPELAFEEQRTAALVAGVLEGLGIEVTRGLARTGVVGTMRRGGATRAIGLRADMDALQIHEQNDVAHRSQRDGVMHACGHDGHTAMLLGAATHLAEHGDFDGVVHLIFQPAEEHAGGGRVMVEEGLFERFPVDAVYGMHNQPGLAAGCFAMRVGPAMAAYDSFDIHVTGRGTHAATPDRGVDPIVVAAEIVIALQTLVARTIDPRDAAIVSVTQIHGGDAYNVIPETVTLRGCTRALRPAVQTALEAAIARIAGSVAAAHGATAEVDYRRGYPPTINTERELRVAAAAAADVAGLDRVTTDTPPVMASEDFAFMLRERPGAYVFIGNGDDPGGCTVHNPRYDFNDDILVLGARYWAALVHRELG